ncbi:MAG: NUDIX hydrolase, partial [Thermoguttaceae bacterium]
SARQIPTKISIMTPSGSSLLLVNNADQILLLLRDDNLEIPYPNMWDLPGGHVEPDETPEQCIVREIREEMGLDIPLPRLFRVTDFPDRIEHTFWFRMNLNLDEIRLTEGQRLRWFSESDVARTELAFGFNLIVDEFFAKHVWRLEL